MLDIIVSLGDARAVAQSYPGSKGQAGTWRFICSLMPKHRVYLEPFLGSGVVLGQKLPSDEEIACDIDPKVVAAWPHRRWWRERPQVYKDDGLRMLSIMKPRMATPLDWFVYIDAPYPLSVRNDTDLYEHEPERDDPAWHKKLLALALSLSCRVMVSCYWHSLYANLAEQHNWRAIPFKSMTRGGVSQEWVWCNYGADVPLHDTRYVGRGFRERERINRKRKRWVSRFSAMPPAERQVIAEALAIANRQE